MNPQNPNPSSSTPPQVPPSAPNPSLPPIPQPITPQPTTNPPMQPQYNTQTASQPWPEQYPQTQASSQSQQFPQAQPAFQPQNPAQQPLPPQVQNQPTNPQTINTNQANVPAAPQVIENPLSTQATLLFSELRDGIVIMKDGSFRAVIACQSINFDLMSEQEREGIEYSYQNFLNSLNFTTQILVRSQKVDIGPYIERLIKIRRNNDNMLLGVLMDDYINFIEELSREANIMDKSFFIIVPYYSSPDMEQTIQQTKNFFKALGKNKGQTVTRINRDVYNKAIEELNNRSETIMSGLFQIGIHSVRLNTKELSQLFYNFNNPDTSVREPLVDFSKMATLYVKKGTK